MELKTSGSSEAQMTEAQPQRPKFEYASLLKFAGLVSILVAMTLVMAKLVALYTTGSASIMASLVDSVMDVGVSLINFLAIRLALRPADGDHRFGHGKAEAIAGLVQAAFIIGSASFLLIEVIDRVINPVALENISTGLSVMVFSIVVTACLVLFQWWVIRRTNSAVIKADSLHYVSDLLSNAAVLLALGLSSLGYVYADTILGGLIALFIIGSAMKIAHQSVDMLMDKELEEEELEPFYTLILSHPKVLGVHDLRSRRSGQKVFLQLHLELEDQMVLKEAHQIADFIENDICEHFKNVEVIVHEDPIGEVDLKMVKNRRTAG